MAQSSSTSSQPQAKISRAPTSDQVAEHIRRMIFNGELRTGDRVPQDAIADALGVSRIPVREALLNMARDGMVYTEPHVGTFVTEFSEQVVRDHFEIYGMLQGMAAVRFMEHATREEMEVLAKLEAEIDALADVHEINLISIEFTRIINIGAKSERLRAILRVLGRMYPIGFFDQVEGAGDSQKAATTAVLQAIGSGSEVQVREACLDSSRVRASLIVEHLTGTGTFK